MKKILLIFAILLLFWGSLEIYSAVKYQRRQAEQAKIPPKAAQVSITILEGWNNGQIADYLEKRGVSNAKDFLSSLNAFDTSGYPLLASKPVAASLEGFIFPDTYFIPAASSSSSPVNQIIIKKALDNFSQKLTGQMQQQAAVQKMSVYQIITLASIVEKESNGPDTEKKIVAGIFYNRLKAGVPLQSDATVNYALGKNSPFTSTQDTLVDSPYNTYKYAGLPKGPICNPSLASIMAVLYPTATDYMYFLTDPKTGQAIFAKTYQEHLINKAKYLK